ncbi:hypothetical protein BDR26DRAFT_891694 [Obelidium mucronatum]|nr:hypothetical protein BDR26DRAFT_891694 [Obelidium mucronatum]
MTPPPASNSTNSSSAKRKAQIRAAQKSFVERRKAYFQTLEAKVAFYETTANERIKELEAKVKLLEAELEAERAKKCPLKDQLPELLHDQGQSQIKQIISPLASLSVQSQFLFVPHTDPSFLLAQSDTLPLITSCPYRGVSQTSSFCPTPDIQNLIPHSLDGSVFPAVSSPVFPIPPPVGVQLQLQPETVTNDLQNFQRFHDAIKTMEPYSLLSRIQSIQISLKSIPSLVLVGNLIDRMCELFLTQTSRCARFANKQSQNHQDQYGCVSSAVERLDNSNAVSSEYLEMKQVRTMLLNSCDPKEVDSVLSILGCSAAGQT